jgi:hypothetical protein
MLPPDATSCQTHFQTCISQPNKEDLISSKCKTFSFSHCWKHHLKCYNPAIAYKFLALLRPHLKGSNPHTACTPSVIKLLVIYWSPQGQIMSGWASKTVALQQSLPPRLSWLFGPTRLELSWNHHKFHNDNSSRPRRKLTGQIHAPLPLPVSKHLLQHPCSI